MERMLITGMEGMAGTHLARMANESGYRVFGTHYPTRYPQYLKGLITSGEITALSCDLTQKLQVDEVVNGVMPEVIIHLAGQSNPARSWEDTTFPDNAAMMNNLLQAIVRTHFRSKIIFASTTALYGLPTPLEPINEDGDVDPQTPYALSKDVLESLLKIYKRKYPDLRYVVARMSNHTGVGRGKGFVETEIGEQILAIEQGAEPNISVRNLLAEVALLDVRDAVRAYIVLVKNEETEGIYNVTPKKSYTVRVVAGQMVDASLISDKGSVRFQSSAVEQFVPARYSSRKILQLGWEPIIPLRQTLEDLLDWMRNPVTKVGYGS